MAKRKRPSDREYERRHNETVEAYVRRVERIYARTRREVSLIAAAIREANPDKIFTFDDYPALREKVNAAFKVMHDAIVSTIATATAEEWVLANIKNDKLARAVLDDEVLKKKVVQRFFNTNKPAYEAFQQRKVKGLGLSDRVWKLTDAYRNELELALDNGIGTGRSAAQLAQDTKQFLKEPDKLFRRVRDKHGELKLSKAAKAYHPGQGVYRSSYKNAERMARTEINMAYRTADHLRNTQFDFVVGFEVVRSNNPYLCPICGPLAGKYPKTFKFVSWHPNCRCHTITILMSQEELQKLNMALLNNEDVQINSVNEVVSPHEGFTEWIKGNKERLLRAKSLPYFIKDNNISLG